MTICYNSDTSALEKHIDEMVHALYGLTPEEIAIVERGNMKKLKTAKPIESTCQSIKEVLN